MNKFFLICLVAATAFFLVDCERRSSFYRSSYGWYNAKRVRAKFGGGGSAPFYGDNNTANKILVVDTTANSESYARIVENNFMSVATDEFSTFGADVDRASYSNIRRYINDEMKPPSDAVRVEEMINYFHYDYPQPQSDDPVKIVTELSECPWNEGHQLLMIGLQAKKIVPSNLPRTNFVFLIDVSGSMSEELPLVKQSMKLLTEKLRAEDQVCIVVYAGAAGCVLDVTPGSDKKKINNAIDDLSSGGSTAGGEGIKLAYEKAKKNFIPDGNNRVVLITDGDFNVGVASEAELQQLVEEERKSGVFLSCLGVGTGNYQDSKMETLADKGNGNYSYLDSETEAKKVLLKEFGGTMFTVAKDVKIQVQFNSKNVQGYRLIGYENRILAKEDFENDKKDAGDMGSDHSVTAIYEIIPVGITSKYKIDEQGVKRAVEDAPEQLDPIDMGVVKLRYKRPQDSISKEIRQPISKVPHRFSDASANLRFASSVALSGLLIRDSKYKGSGSYDFVIKTANAANSGDDEEKKEFVLLVEKVVKVLAKEKDQAQENEKNRRKKF